MWYVFCGLNLDRDNGTLTTLLAYLVRSPSFQRL